MSRIIRLKNNSGSDGNWVGQTIVDTEYHNITETDTSWRDSSAVFTSIAAGDLVVNKGADVSDDILDPITGWNWLIGDTMPKSDLGDKMAVHSSSMPLKPGKSFILQWIGAGDDITTGDIGEGELLAFQMNTGTEYVIKDIHFHPDHGHIYLHEGYAKWEGGMPGDHFDAFIVAGASALQPAVSLDLEITDNWVHLAAGGPGAGTHGFAATPVLIPRTFSKDGDWDYDATNGLVPNLAGDGGYKISDIERKVHRYMTKIPSCGTSTYTRLTSDETAWLPPGFFIRIEVHNVADHDWTFAVMMEVFRERTYVP